MLKLRLVGIMFCVSLCFLASAKDPLELSSLKSGKLVRWTRPVGEVMRSRLFWIKNDHSIEVKGDSLLKGKVTIRNGTQAVEYVRLFSNPRYADAVGYPIGIELRYFKDIDGWWLPDGEGSMTADILHGRRGEGLFGVFYSKALAKKLSSIFRVRKVEQGFEITRPVMMFKGTRLRWTVYKSVELVTTAGEYRRLKLVDISETKGVSGIRFRLPLAL